MLNRLALLTLGLAAGLALCEVLPRMAPGLLSQSMQTSVHFYRGRRALQDIMVGDPYLGYRLRRDLALDFPADGQDVSLRTVSFDLGDIGFRDIGTHPPFDTVAIGDSFTFCQDVQPESCWVRRLSDARRHSIADLGVSGYSNQAEVRMLERYGRRLHPRLVVWTVFPNDLLENVSFEAWTRSGTDDQFSWMRFNRRGPLTDWLARHSLVFQVLDGARRASTRYLYYHHEGNLDFVFRFDDFWLAALHGIDDLAGWHLMQEALLTGQRIATESGAQLLVVLAPTKEHVYWNVVRRYVPDELRSADPDEPYRVVSRFLAAHSIPTCSLVEPLQQEAAAGEQVYWRITGHWNDRGNAVTATAVGRCLTDQRLWPEPLTVTR